MHVTRPWGAKPLLSLQHRHSGKLIRGTQPLRESLNDVCDATSSTAVRNVSACRRPIQEQLSVSPCELLF